MPLKYNINYLVYVCILLDCHWIFCHYVYGSKTVKVFALSYGPEDIKCCDYTYEFNIIVNNR